ncbi:MAG TPA: hypothetical protein VKU39_22120 [Streptosporangiaceae bacterium]|nr:hypothetical protein [Streptosporangiaceae bacterium]
MTTLQDLYGTLQQARQAGDLTLTAGSSGSPDLDAFLTTLPGQSLTVHRAQLQLRGMQQATLTVSGGMSGTWPLPGLAKLSLATQSVIVTYSQTGPTAPITVGLAVTATMTVGTSTVTLTSTLQPGAFLSFAVQHGDHGSVSVADAATAISDGSAQDWVPAAVPVLGALRLSDVGVQVGYAQGGSTVLTFTMDAPPGQVWSVLAGQHVLRQVGVTLVSSYSMTAGSGPAQGFSGNVHATLDLGQGIGVIIGLGPGNVWDIELDATGGLPALGTIAAVAGMQSQVQAGLAAIGLGDITLQAVRIAIDRTTYALAYIDIAGSITVAGVTIEASVQLPSFLFGGMLSPDTPVSLSALLTSALGGTGGLPDIQVSMLSFSADPQTGDYSLHAYLDDGSLAVGSYGLASVDLQLNKQATGMTGSISAGVVAGGSNFFVTGTYGQGWTVTGQLDQLDLGALIGEVLASVRLPDPLTGLQLSDVSATWNLTTAAFSFSGQLTMNIQLGPLSVASTLTCTVNSAVDPQSRVRTTTGTLTGSLSIGTMVFNLRYDFIPGRQVLTGTWNAQGGAGLADLASAFGLAVPGGDVTLPDLSLTSMSFTLDWSQAGEQAFQLTAATSIGDAFFVVARPQPGQPWAFAFGAAISGAVRLSAVLGPLGVDATELDFITLTGAAFLVASAPFPSLQVPGFAALAGMPLRVSQGVTAAVLVDLGGTPARPDVTTLKTVLAGSPPVLLGEVTLSTSITAIAVTVELAGSLTLTGPGGLSVTLTDVSLIFKPDPLALTLSGSVAFPLGGVPILATGLLTIAANEVDGALNVQGQNGQVLPFPMGFQGVHLTDIGVEIGVTYEPPSLMMGLLGRFIIGPGPATPAGPVAPRALTAVPPSDEFVLILGLEGEVPNPLLLSMYLQQVSFGTAVTALTNQPPASLPSLLNDISASDVMLYWCDAAAGLQQPDGTWAYPGFGFNAILDIYGVHAFAELMIDSTKGITGDACIDPLSIPGVISLTGTGKGTPAAYTGQVVVRAGGAVIHVSTLASPYLNISWVVTLFSTVTSSVTAELTSSGFTFAVDGSAYGFSSSLTCSFQISGSMSMAFSVALTLDVDLGSLNGMHLGHVSLVSVSASCGLSASASAITVDASFSFDGATVAMPALTVSTPFSSLSAIPAAIAQQIENSGAAIFAAFTGTVASYLGIAYKGLVAGADEIGGVLKTGYGQTEAQAAAAMKAAGYGVADVGNALIGGWNATAGDVASALQSAGYAVSDAGTFLKNAFSLGPDALHSALSAAGYAASDIGNFFNSLGGDFASWASSNLDPTHW